MQEDTHATDGRADTAVASHVGALATPRVDVPLTPRADMTATTRDEWLADCGLTSRERAVVRLVMEGRTFQEVAERLGIAPSTAKTYFQRSLTKLGVASRDELSGLWAAHRDDGVARAEGKTNADEAATCADGAATQAGGQATCADGAETRTDGKPGERDGTSTSGPGAKGVLLAACRRACASALLILAFVYPQRIVRDGCIGWPVAAGCGVALLIAGLCGRRIVRLCACLDSATLVCVTDGSTNPDSETDIRTIAARAVLWRTIRGVAVCAATTSVALRAIYPVDAWLDGPFAFVTTLGAACLALALAARPTRAGAGGRRAEVLARVLLGVLCAIVATVQPAANAMLFLAGVVTSGLLLRSPEYLEDDHLEDAARSQEPNQGPKAGQGRELAWPTVAVTLLATLGWAMAGSLGRPYTLGVPALVGVSFCCVALLLHAVSRGKQSLVLLTCDAAVALAVGLGMRDLSCALVAFPLVVGAFALGGPTAGDATGEEKPSHGGPATLSAAWLVAAGTTAVLAPPVATLYHTLATAPETKGLALSLFIALFSLVGCVALLPELLHLLGRFERADKKDGASGTEAPDAVTPNAVAPDAVAPDAVAPNTETPDGGLSSDGAPGVAAFLARRGLSETQVAVLAAIYEGKTSREIQSALVLSRGAVNSARRDGYRTMGVHSADELRRVIDASRAARPDESL